MLTECFYNPSLRPSLFRGQRNIEIEVFSDPISYDTLRINLLTAIPMQTAVALWTVILKPRFAIIDELLTYIAVSNHFMFLFAKMGISPSCLGNERRRQRRRRTIAQSVQRCNERPMANGNPMWIRTYLTKLLTSRTRCRHGHLLQQ